MPGVSVESVVAIIVALFGGGVIGVVVKALTEKKKVNAEANNTNIKSILEIDQRMNERMTKLETRVANLEQENYKLKTEKLELEQETRRLESIISHLETENKELHEENHALKAELETYKNNIEGGN